MRGEPRRRWFRGASCALGLALASCRAPANSTARGNAVRAEFDRLKEELARLDGFLAEYELVGPDGTSTFEFRYEAPGNMRASFREPGKGCESLTIADGVLSGEFRDPEAETGEARFRFDMGSAYARCRGELEESLRLHAPAIAGIFATASSRASYGPVIDFSIFRNREKSPSGKRIGVDVKYERHDCSDFHWLCTLEKKADEFELGEGSMSLEGEGRAITISTETGFITSCWSDDGESRCEMRLVRLLRNEKLEEARIEIPDDLPPPPDEFARLARYGAVGDTCGMLRAAIRREVDAGHIALSAETRGALAKSYAAFFAAPIEESGHACIEAQSKWINEHAGELRAWEEERIADGDDPDGVRGSVRVNVEKSRVALAEAVGAWRDRELEVMLLSMFEPKSELESEIRELEREAAHSIWVDAVSKPVMAYFDEKLFEPWAG